MKNASNLCKAIFFGLILSATAQAGTVTGKVVDALNKPVVGAKVKFKGLSFPVTPKTDLLGNFSVVVANGKYDISIVPASTVIVPKLLPGVVVTLTTNLGVIKLLPGFPIAGNLQTTASVPVSGGDLNVYDQATRRKLFTPTDTTDLLGNFQVVVPAGNYRVRFRPKTGQLLVAKELYNLSVTKATLLGVIKLRPGVKITGAVMDAAARTPLADIDLDVDDALTGERIVTPQDNTLANGIFSAIIPAGLFHFSFDPPVGSAYVGKQFFNINVTASSSVGIFGLDKGLILTGTVLGPGAKPVFNVNLDVETAKGGTSIYVSQDNTDAAGKFSIAVKPGSYRLRIQPPFATGLLGTKTAVLNVSTNLTVPTVNVVPGVLLSGTIRGFTGVPEAGANLDVLHPTTGDELVTANDVTDALGKYSILVPKGSWNVLIRTKKLSLSRVELVKGVAIAGPTTLDRKLSLVPMACYLATTGIPTVKQLTAVTGTLVFANFTTKTQTAMVSLGVIDEDGVPSYVMPPIKLSFAPFQVGALPGVPLPVPLVNAAKLGRLFRMEFKLADPVTGAEMDKDSFKLVIN